MTKRLSPNALDALTEALSTVFWYKRDLWRFLTSATADAALVARLDWES